MANSNCQKIKLLKLLEMLQQETDEQHPLTTAVLCNRLCKMGISCDRRTLSKDIALLNEQGYEVMWCWVGKEKGYYIADRLFSIPELKILIDAVQAASFITEKKSSDLIARIASLGGSHSADVLQGNLVCFKTTKHTNEAIYYNVNYLEDALLQRKQIAFFYYDLDEHGQKVYRREGRRYVVHPVALVYNEDNYYLIGYSARYNNTANYRVDRMDQVEVLPEDISQKALLSRSNVAEYTEQVFKMYGGPTEEITIEFHRDLIGVVYDKFGEDTQMTARDNGWLSATVKVQISPTFWGWLFQFGTEMKLISPTRVVEEYQDKIRQLLQM